MSMHRIKLQAKAEKTEQRPRIMPPLAKLLLTGACKPKKRQRMIETQALKVQLNIYTYLLEMRRQSLRD